MSEKNLQETLNERVSPKKRVRKNDERFVPSEFVLAHIPDAIPAAQAREIIGIGKTELFQRTRDGVYKTVRCERGFWWYSHKECVSSSILQQKKKRERAENLRRREHEAIAAVRASFEKKNGKANATNGAGVGVAHKLLDGDTAKIVFEELANGLDAIAIVCKHALVPELVEEAVSTWHRLKGGVYLTSEEQARIEKLPLSGQFPLRKGEDLVVALEEAFSSEGGRPCARCQKNNAKICAPCTTTMVNQAKLEGQQAAATADPFNMR